MFPIEGNVYSKYGIHSTYMYALNVLLIMFGAIMQHLANPSAILLLPQNRRNRQKQKKREITLHAQQTSQNNEFKFFLDTWKCTSYSQKITGLLLHAPVPTPILSDSRSSHHQ